MKTNTRVVVISAMLAAVGIAIPVVMPVPFKILIEPASFTLCSHVPVFLAMFVSPLSAGITALGVATGFFISTTPVIAARALSHIVFALTGAFLLHNVHAAGFARPRRLFMLGALLAVIHAVCEVAVVIPFYFSRVMAEGFYQSGFFYSVVLLVGVGTIIHSMIDFTIAYFVAKALARARALELPQ